MIKQENTTFFKSEKLRTSLCPWIVVKFWYEFILCIAIAGLVKYIIKYTFKSSI